MKQITASSEFYQYWTAFPLVIGDVGAYAVAIQLKEPVTGTFRVSARKPTGTVQFVTAQLNESMGASVTLNNAMYDTEGVTTLYLEVFDDVGGKITEKTIDVDVTPGAGEGNPAQDDVTKLDSLIAQTTQAAAAAVIAAGTITDAVDEATVQAGYAKAQGDYAKAQGDNLQSALANKVDKISGKGLSTNDYTTAEKTKLAGIAAGAQVNSVTSVAGKTGAVTLAKSDIGLANVDNTSDANKPVSTATQTALNAKADRQNIVGGGQLGAQAIANEGGAVGRNADATGGFAGGENTFAGDGCAIGKGAKTQGGDGLGIDAIQLGNGTNIVAKSLQVYGYQLMGANGIIPTDRLPKIGKGQRIVIGTSTVGHTAKDVDYLCDGTADDVEINAAIASVNNYGGHIVFREGNYNIEAPIVMSKSSVALEGAGAMFTKRFTGTTNDALVKIAAENCRVSGLRLDGNKEMYAVSAPLIFVAANNCTIDNNSCVKSYGDAIEIKGANALVINNRCLNNRMNGINIPYEGGSSVMMGNICNANGNYGIVLGYYNPSSVVGNICSENKAGIYVASTGNHIIADNHAMNNSEYGIFVYGYNCMITGNRAYRGNGNTSDYTGTQYTIYAMNCNKCVFANNLILGKNYVVSGGGDAVFDNNIY